MSSIHRPYTVCCHDFTLLKLSIIQETVSSKLQLKYNDVEIWVGFHFFLVLTPQVAITFFSCCGECTLSDFVDLPAMSGRMPEYFLSQLSQCTRKGHIKVVHTNLLISLFPLQEGRQTFNRIYSREWSSRVRSCWNCWMSDIFRVANEISDVSVVSSALLHFSPGRLVLKN